MTCRTHRRARAPPSSRRLLDVGVYRPPSPVRARARPRQPPTVASGHRNRRHRPLRARRVARPPGRSPHHPPRDLLAFAAATAASLAAPSSALAANDAVLAALKRKETADLVGPDGSVQTRLNLALDELRRAQQLASVGEYTNARAMLRKGNLESVRGDLVKVGAYLRVQRPTFDQFEALAVTGGLDAFDNAMRARQVGVAEVTDRDVAVNAKAAVAALEEVCYVLGKDKTYEEMKARLADPNRMSRTRRRGRDEGRRLI